MLGVCGGARDGVAVAGVSGRLPSRIGADERRVSAEHRCGEFERHHEAGGLGGLQGDRGDDRAHGAPPLEGGCGSGGVETLEPDDYRDADGVLGTDRGQEASLASFTGTAGWAMTNYLSNVTAQKSGLNQVPWKGLEDAVRDVAKGGTYDGVYVMKGPAYERPMAAMPGADEVHLVPSGYWKIVAVEDRDGVRAAGFFLD